MVAQFRVEREWVPLKQHLPTPVYSQLLDLIQNDMVYKNNERSGNEKAINAMIRLAVTQWLEQRNEIEELNGTAGYRKMKAEERKGYEAYIAELDRTE